ncbi:MAG: PP2C family protein-serine/threonine phosphatase [Planctomycetota bacterium]|jgi:sigma-B regulation protein RsbU (phosphoserine phosphatase)
MVPQLAENLKLQESLAVAGSVQRDLLPKTPPEFPGLDVYGANEPYEQIGGDYFDFLDLRPWGDQRLAAVVGDVVGHGIAAALLMATARAHVRSRAQPLPELGALFNEINLRLSADLGEEQFMTLALYAFDAKNGRLDWTSAGQDAAFHYRKQTGEIEEIALKNVPLGVLPDWEYKAGSREDLARGDVLLIGTDGIWETRNKEREEFGKERVRNLLQMNRERGAQELVETIFGAVARFRGELPRQDDVTLVAIRIV